LVGLHHLGHPMSSGLLDGTALTFEALLCLAYLAKSSALVYQIGPVRRWLSAGVLTVATLYILYAYRLILFLVTLWAT